MDKMMDHLQNGSKAIQRNFPILKQRRFRFRANPNQILWKSTKKLNNSFSDSGHIAHITQFPRYIMNHDQHYHHDHDHDHHHRPFCHRSRGQICQRWVATLPPLLSSLTRPTSRSLCRFCKRKPFFCRHFRKMFNICGQSTLRWLWWELCSWQAGWCHSSRRFPVKRRKIRQKVSSFDNGWRKKGKLWHQHHHDGVMVMV